MAKHSPLDLYLNKAMQKLHAGRLSLEYSDGSIWNISLGGEELVRRIYLVFQDINWTSRPFNILQEKWEIHEDRFSAEIDLCGTKDAENFQVKMAISGNPDGVVSYRFEGSSEKEFKRNRLGLCLLHPIANLAGRDCTLTLSDGLQVESNFPLEISANQPFKNLAGISHEAVTGEKIKIEFFGEIFETEDHRNWSDASFKTYCTPIDLPFPAEVEARSQINQEIRISLTGVANNPPTPLENQILITLANSEVNLPDFGLSLADVYSDSDHDSFDELGLKHLRLNIDLEKNTAAGLAKAVDLTNSLNLELWVALNVDGEAQLIQFLNSKIGILKEVDRFLIFSKSSKVTPAQLVAAARNILGADASITGGTDLYFTEINRGSPVVPGIDQINFSINPQVHSFDDRTLIQNLATQEVIAKNARRLAGSLKVGVGPISLRPRFNPNATAPEKDVSNTALPSSVDLRQLTYFAEAWTAISMKYLSQSGDINSATYFETVGWRGIRESDSGSQDSTNFPSKPSEPFPVWKVFAAIKGFSKSVPSYSTKPEIVDSFVIRNSEATRIILANFSDEQQQVHFEGIDLPLLKLPPLSTTYLDV